MSDWSRNFTANVTDRDLSNLIDRVVAQVRTACNVSRNKAMVILLSQAVEIVSSQPEFSIDDMRKYARLYEMQKRVRERQSLRASLKEIYAEFGLDGLGELCDDVGMQVDEMLQLIHKQDKPKSDYAKMSDWIESFLSDGKAARASDVANAAVSDGILPERVSNDFDKQHRLFKVAACNLGVSGGKRGYWQAPNE